MHSIPRQDGKAALITGGNTGLGYQSALSLAVAGAAVTIAVRNLDKGAEAARRIHEHAPAADVQVLKLDLADQHSIAEFAAAWSGSLDILVANAGIMLTPTLQFTVDGFELQMGTNHLGHYALVGQLLPALADGARVVSLSSMAHRGAGRLDRGLGLSTAYAPMRMYGQSKLATAIFGIELDRRVKAAGRNIVSVVAHPGWSATDLFNRNYDDQPSLAVLLSRKVTAILGSSPAHGAQSQLVAAVAPGLTGGEYIGPRYLLRGKPAETKLTKWAYREDDGRWLWEESASLTGVDFGI